MVQDAKHTEERYGKFIYTQRDYIALTNMQYPQSHYAIVRVRFHSHKDNKAYTE